MKQTLQIILFLSFFISVSHGCKESYDPELETPDMDDSGMQHGHNLTTLGWLVRAPWNLDTNDTSSANILKYTVFEFQKDGSMKYWFKSDYLKSPLDTITILDGNKNIRHSIRDSKALLKEHWLKNIYTNGSWKANFKDSTIQISFGKNTFSLLPIEGKYLTLEGGEMVIMQTSNTSIKDSNYLKTYLGFKNY